MKKLLCGTALVLLGNAAYAQPVPNNMTLTFSSGLEGGVSGAAAGEFYSGAGLSVDSNIDGIQSAAVFAQNNDTSVDASAGTYGAQSPVCISLMSECGVMTNGARFDANNERDVQVSGSVIGTADVRGYTETTGAAEGGAATSGMLKSGLIGDVDGMFGDNVTINGMLTTEVDRAGAVTGGLDNATAFEFRMTGENEDFVSAFNSGIVADSDYTSAVYTGTDREGYQNPFEEIDLSGDENFANFDASESGVGIAISTLGKGVVSAKGENTSSGFGTFSMDSKFSLDGTLNYDGGIPTP